VANLLFRGGASRSVTKQQIFDYIEVYYNRKRLHLNVDFRFPEAFKLKKVAKQRAYEIMARTILGVYVYIEKYSYNHTD
jgi:2-hydroxychromene-2-carboxylate isomerase